MDRIERLKRRYSGLFSVGEMMVAEIMEGRRTEMEHASNIYTSMNEVMEYIVVDLLIAKERCNGDREIIFEGEKYFLEKAKGEIWVGLHEEHYYIYRLEETFEKKRFRKPMRKAVRHNICQITKEYFILTNSYSVFMSPPSPTLMPLLIAFTEDMKESSQKAKEMRDAQEKTRATNVRDGLVDVLGQERYDEIAKEMAGIAEERFSRKIKEGDDGTRKKEI